MKNTFFIYFLLVFIGDVTHQAWSSTQINGMRPGLSVDFCKAFLATKPATSFAPGAEIDASGNPVAPANLPASGMALDDLGRPVMSADLSSNGALKLPETMTFPLRFAVSKRPLETTNSTSSATTGTSASMGTSNTSGTLAAQVTQPGTTTQEADGTSNTTDPTVLANVAGTTGSAGTNKSVTNSSSQTQSNSIGSTEAFDKTAELRMTVHKDGRLFLEDQPLEEDQTQGLRADCQKLLSDKGS